MNSIFTGNTLLVIVITLSKNVFTYFVPVFQTLFNIFKHYSDNIKISFSLNFLWWTGYFFRCFSKTILPLCKFWESERAISDEDARWGNLVTKETSSLALYSWNIPVLTKSGCFSSIAVFSRSNQLFSSLDGKFLISPSTQYHLLSMKTGLWYT